MALKLLLDFFEDLNKNKINYCHWKSNLFIEKSMDGETDLDVLIDREDIEKFISIVLRYNFKHVIPEKHKMYVGIDNFIGFDEETQKTIHLHVYFRMISGKHLLKDFNFPFEKIHLESSKEHPKLKVKLPQIENEFLILVCRILAKIRILKHIVKLGKPFPKHLEDEIINFIKIVDKEKFKKILTEINSKKAQKIIIEFINLIEKRKLNKLKLYSLSNSFKKEFTENRRFNFIEKNFLYIFRKFLTLLSKNDRNKRRMILNKTGKIFAFVGVPGSGKSSTTSEIKKWLNIYLGVKKYYLGIPQKTWQERLGLFIFIPINLPYKLFISKLEKNNPLFKIYSHIYDLALCIRWIGVAKSSFKIYKQAKYDAFNGQIVIIDRFPVKEINETMKEEPVEAPRIEAMSINKNSKIVKKYISKEFEIYQKIATDQNITLFWLDVDTQESVRRGRNKKNVELQNKYFKKIKPNNENRLRIDANLPHKETLSQIKKKIWEKI